MTSERSPQPTSWINHPSIVPNGRYKFSSFQINLDNRIKVSNRQTYDVLDWLGDCGGLADALFRLASFVISVFTSYNIKNVLLTTLFRSTQSSKKDAQPQKELAEPSSGTRKEQSLQLKLAE